MHKDNDYVGVTEAARLLGVTTRQVTRLGEKGDIVVPFRGLVDRGSIERHLSDRGFSRRRSWDEHTCWAAIALLSGLEVDWLGDVQTSRLRGRLRRIASDEEHGAHDLIGRARGRATVHTFEAFDFITPRVKKDVLIVGRRGLDLAPANKTSLDAYIAQDDLAKVVKRNFLTVDTRGKLVLRATKFDLALIRKIAIKGNGALSALDAASSTDEREHGVGVRALTKHLRAFACG